MPCLIVHRNFPADEKSIENFQNRLTTITEKVLGKPKAYIMVIMEAEKQISFGSSPEPALFIEVKSIGLPGDSPAELSRAICSEAENLFAVPADRIYIEFADSPRNLWGWNGGTF